ncbi:MAG TPA: proton-conducting transporter membrane subunit [Solirubrobacterales bacterium]|nr:proton-conducting transporter membrane subunit [Solirubrobacterales bacterium]
MTVVYAVAMAALVLAPFAATRFARTAAALATLGCVGLVAVGIAAALGTPATLQLGSWIGFGHSALRADGLAGIFLALTGVTGAATSLAYGELSPGRWLTGLHAVLVAAVAIAIGADNGFLFLLAWEILTVVIFLLASADRDRPGALLAAYLTAGLTKIGGAALLAAIALLYAKTGSFSLGVWEAAHLGAGTAGVLFALFLVAFGTKVGVLPLQGALPAGYGSAPRLGAASLSVALCAGYYGLWRFVFEIAGPLPVWCGDALLIVGPITAAAGILYAITQDDLRRFLGFSTVEHAGIVLVGFGVALLGQAAGNERLAAAGLLAATLHVCAHGISKTLALIVVDRVGVATGEGGLDPLGGLAGPLPVSGAGFGVACLTLAAIPPLGGFVSEWFTFEALLQGFRMPTLLSQLLCALAAAMLALTAGLGLLAFAKLYGFAFLGRARTAFAGLREPSRLALGVVPIGIVGLLLGAAAPWEIDLLGAGLERVLGLDPAATAIKHPLTLGPVFPDFSVLAPTWLAIVLPTFALIAVAIALVARRQGPRRAPVWVTGSGAELVAVQYRPSAYSNPIRVVLRGYLGYRSELVEGPADDRGPTFELRTRVVLAVEELVYRPLAAAALALAAGIRRFQSGRLSSYILYMLAVLIVILALIPALH